MSLFTPKLNESNLSKTYLQSTVINSEATLIINGVGTSRATKHGPDDFVVVLLQ